MMQCVLDFGIVRRSQGFFFVLMLFFILLAPGSTHEPEFDVDLPHLKVKMGSDAAFTCIVKHLNEYKVAWIRSEDKAIIALHSHMVTHNHRFSVTHNGHNTWTLHIKGVLLNDTGSYLCQINTDPQRSITGSLEVVVPADIVDEETSSDVVVLEGQSATLKCKATGYPQPKVRWMRQDRRPLPLAKELLTNPTEKLVNWDGEQLRTRPLVRSDNSIFLCLANNSVPPLVSKRVMVYVHFSPLIKVSNQLVAAYSNAGVNVTLECSVEAVPRPVVSWFRKDGQLILNQAGKIWQDTTQINEYSLKMKLTIANLQSIDFTDYNCSVGSSMGSDSAVIKLQELPPPPTIRTTTTAIPDWKKHVKHNNDRDANGNTIKHSKDKRKQGRNKSEHYHRDYDSQEGGIVFHEHLTTSSSLSSLNSGISSGGSGLNKRNQKETSSNTRIYTNAQFPGASSSATSPLCNPVKGLKLAISNFQLSTHCCLPFIFSLIPSCLMNASFLIGLGILLSILGTKWN